MEIRDQLGRQLHLKSTPKRLISLVPSQTELLVDLGLEENILGITKFCVHPKRLRKIKKIVGGTKSVHLDRIQALKPDIILCNKEENTKEMVAALEAIAPVHVSDISNLQEALELMLQYGEIFQKQNPAEILVHNIQQKLEDLKQKNKEKRPKKVAYLIWKDPLMAAGKGTFIDELLQLNQLDNVFSKTRYPETSLEELSQKKPDVLMLSSEPFPFSEKHIEMFSGLGTEIKLVDGEFFSWYGSRLEKAMEYFEKLDL